MRMIFITCLLALSALTSYGKDIDTFQVYFTLNRSALTNQTLAYVNKLVDSHQLTKEQDLIIVGYTDDLGNNPHNDSLSLTRAQKIRDYLVSLGLDETKITVYGKGKIDRPMVEGKTGYAPDRKVQIIIDRSKKLTDLKVNETLELRNIFFEPGLPTILPASFPQLEKLYGMLNSNKHLTIQIEGHICCKDPKEGTDEPYEKSTLSEYRAKAIYEYLVAKGIDKDRLKYIGLGNTKPMVMPEVTEEDREKNRRVEIRVLSK